MDVLPYIITLTARHIDFFSFENKFSQERFKRFAELAIFFHYVSKCPSSRDADGYETIKNALIDNLSMLSPDDVFKNFYTSYHIIMPYVFIRREKAIEGLEKCLDAVCDEEFFSPEIPPHRHMEWSYMLYNADKIRVLPAPPEGILTKGLFLPFVDRDLTYALTHAIFYATDFGFAENPALKESADALAFRVACLAARFKREKDVDVTLELAISFLALYPYVAERIAADAWLKGILHIVDRVVLDTHFIPTPGEIDADTDGVLQKKYHTLFVLGIFASLLKTRMGEGVIDGTAFSSLTCVPNADEYASPTILPESAALDLAHGVVESLKRKNYSPEPYAAYQKHFGRNPFLEEEIARYLSVFRRRNRDGILWNKEFDALGVSDAQRESLRIDCEKDFCAKMAF
ncbi:MAG: hypothetical protein ABW189_07435 [Rickettsiales bacterium]